MNTFSTTASLRWRPWHLSKQGMDRLHHHDRIYHWSNLGILCRFRRTDARRRHPQPLRSSKSPHQAQDPRRIDARQPGPIKAMTISLIGSESKLTYMPRPSDDSKQRKRTYRQLAEYLSQKVNIEEGLVTTTKYFRKLLSAVSACQLT